MNIERFIVDNLWVATSAWMVLHTLDYCLTIHGARLRQRRAKGIFEVEGSYELTPQFQRIVDEGTWFSRLFALHLLRSSLLIFILQLAARRIALIEPFFLFLVGGLFLRQMVVLARHIRNIVSFSTIAEGTTGAMRQKRWYAYQMSAVDLLSHGAILAIAAAVTRDIMLCGGAAFTWLNGVEHLLLMAKVKRNDSQPDAAASGES